MRRAGDSAQGGGGSAALRHVAAGSARDDRGGLVSCAGQSPFHRGPSDSRQGACAAARAGRSLNRQSAA